MIPETLKQKIIDEYNSFKELMYADKTKEERQKLGQFFTPPEYTIPMIEKYYSDNFSKMKILDPCCGSGNFLAACLIAGANPKNIFGNDYDAQMVDLCRKRLSKICGDNKIFNINIHQGNALQKICLTEFSEKYNQLYDVARIDDLNYGKSLDELEFKKEELW